MRTLAVLAILLMLFAVGCGGDEEMTSANPDADTPDAEKPEKPEKKKPVVSPEAYQASQDYKMVKNIREYDTKVAKALEKAKQYAFGPADAQFYVGELYRIAGDDAAAATAYSKFIIGCPDSRNLNTARFYAGQVCAKTGDLSKAEKYLNDLIAASPDSVKMIRVLGTDIATAYAEKGETEKSIPFLKAAADRGSTYAAEELMAAQWLAEDFSGAVVTADKRIAMAEGKAKDTERAKIFKARCMLMGKPAKPIEAEGFHLSDFSVDQLKGKVHLVYFWKMPMRGNALRTTKMMSKIYDEYGDKGLMIVGLNKPYGYDPSEHDEGSGRDLPIEQEIKALDIWAQQEDVYKVRWPLGVTKDERMQEPYGFYPSQAIPASALVDKKGRLRYFVQGADQGADESVSKKLKSAIAVLLAE